MIFVVVPIKSLMLNEHFQMLDASSEEEMLIEQRGNTIGMPTKSNVLTPSGLQQSLIERK